MGKQAARSEDMGLMRASLTVWVMNFDARRELKTVGRLRREPAKGIANILPTIVAENPPNPVYMSIYAQHVGFTWLTKRCKAVRISDSLFILSSFYCFNLYVDTR